MSKLGLPVDLLPSLRPFDELAYFLDVLYLSFWTFAVGLNWIDIMTKQDHDLNHESLCALALGDGLAPIFSYSILLILIISGKKRVHAPTPCTNTTSTKILKITKMPILWYFIELVSLGKSLYLFLKIVTQDQIDQYNFEASMTIQADTIHIPIEVTLFPEEAVKSCFTNQSSLMKKGDQIFVVNRKVQRTNIHWWPRPACCPCPCIFLSIWFPQIYIDGHNGERAMTFPMMMSVGDTNCAVAILSARSLILAYTWKIKIKEW